MAEETLGTTAIAQIGIVVRDIEASSRAWAAIFGLPVPEIMVSPPVEEAHTEYEGWRTPARVRQAFFRMGSLDIELLEPVGEPSTWNDQLVQHGNSMHHIAFRLQGMQDKLDMLAAKGIQLVQRGDYPGGRYAYVDSTSQLGLVLELLERV
jgi:catechol 2,3-dioxygenase-like lactoylglutathione lyase family enzyme